MANNEVSLFDGKLIVVVPSKYCVYEKPLPPGLTRDIDWLGNFGLIEIIFTDPKQEVPELEVKNGEVDRYKILVPNRADKKLVFWDGTKAVPVPEQGIVPKNNMPYRMGVFGQGDPSIGWG